MARPAAEWIARLEAAGVPSAPVLRRSEMINHPQIEANGILFESVHPGSGRLRQARPAAKFSRTDFELVRGGAELGEHTDEVLAEAGFSAEEIARLRASGLFGDAAEAAQLSTSTTGPRPTAGRLPSCSRSLAIPTTWFRSTSARATSSGPSS